MNIPTCGNEKSKNNPVEKKKSSFQVLWHSAQQINLKKSAFCLKLKGIHGFSPIKSIEQGQKHLQNQKEQNGSPISVEWAQKKFKSEISKTQWRNQK